MHPLLTGLNDEQRAAALHRGGPAITVAGPGAGKSRTLLTRQALLIAEGMDPRAMLSVTFTKKAARELRERLRLLVGAAAADLLTTGTFHSLCARWLRRDIAAVGRRRDFSIYDADDAERVITAIYKAHDWETKGGRVGATAARIGSWKNAGMRPALAEMRLDTNDPHATRDLQTYGEYEAALRAANALDFDDLLLTMKEVLEADPLLLRRYQVRWQDISCDEVQDDNAVQNRILLYLAGPNQHLFLIGDSQQSIYRFRGAMPGALAALHAELPQAKLYRLGANYRSTPQIVAMAQHLIDVAPERDKGYTTRIWTTNAPGLQVQAHTALDGDVEAERIASTIAEHIDQGGKAGDWAVIYRVHALSRPIEQALVRRRIHYQMVGGLAFYERAEVKDVLAYLRLLANPYDEVAFARAANTPLRGFGEVSVAKVVAAARVVARSPLDVLLDLDGPLTPVKLTPRARAGAQAFRDVMIWLQAEAQRVGIVDLLLALLERIAFVRHLDETHGGEHAADRWRNVQALVAAAAPLAAQPVPDQLRAFLDDIALFSSVDAPTGTALGGVELMTAHASKGREFPCVWLPAVEEDIIPFHRAAEDEDIDEDRRLLFVAMTRAMRRLVLSVAERRRLYREELEMQPSRFLAALPAAQLEALE